MMLVNDDLQDRLEAARKLADSGGLPVRRKDADLYALLSVCLGICEEVIAANREDELREIFRVSVDKRNPEVWGRGREESNNGKGRRFAYPSSDAFILVTRYVLDSEESRANKSRYAQALRVAAERGLRSDSLAAWLSENGGINTLFKSRPVAASEVVVKTLHLNDQVRMPRVGTTTLTLRMDHRGFYDVLEVSNGPTA
jgi:hypothetical protein